MQDRKHPQELLESLRRLSDDDLVARLKSLAARERRATALLVAHLAELDTRDLHLRAGYPSLFIYCREVLALSEHEAYNRMEAARTARRFPLVLDLLASGAVNLTTVRLLGPHLTADNHARVLESARAKRKVEVEEIVAGLAPRPDVPPSVRKLAVRNAVAAPPGESYPSARFSCPSASFSCPSATLSCPSATSSPAPPDDAALVRAENSPPPASCPRGLVEHAPAAAPPQVPLEASAELTPQSRGRYRYQLTIGATTLDKLRLAKDMLRHALPSGDDEALLDRALTLLLDDLARKKFGSEESARTSRKAATDSRHVPVAVKRAVWLRDLGRCAFVAEDGHRCGERAFVEFHHLHPFAAGGEATIEGIQLRCARHNRYEARLFFPRPGDRDFVLERLASGGATRCSTVAGSRLTSPTALQTAVGRPGARPPVGPSRAQRQPMLL
jgi:hypothetical protein